jgi:hypothetical protein
MSELKNPTCNGTSIERENSNSLAFPIRKECKDIGQFSNLDKLRNVTIPIYFLICKVTM